ncbi:MAG: DUF4054 domain-containing protein [Rhodospirillaceae bacterium]|nr:DUF4054 domain-containing protein [Rhodospirillaceae bacterium]
MSDVDVILTVPEWRGMFPAIQADFSDDQVDFALTVGKTFMRVHKQALGYATAHLLTVGDRAGVRMSKAGDLAVTLSEMSDSDDQVFWGSTQYGRMFHALRRQLRVARFLVA